MWVNNGGMKGNRGREELFHPIMCRRHAAQRYQRVGCRVVGMSSTTHQHTQSSSPLHSGSASKLLHPQLSWLVRSARGLVHTVAPRYTRRHILTFMSFSLVLTSCPLLSLYYPIYSDMHLSLRVALRRSGLELKLKPAVLTLQALWRTHRLQWSYNKPATVICNNDWISRKLWRIMHSTHAFSHLTHSKHIPP